MRERPSGEKFIGLRWAINLLADMRTRLERRRNPEPEAQMPSSFFGWSQIQRAEEIMGGDWISFLPLGIRDSSLVGTLHPEVQKFVASALVSEAVAYIKDPTSTEFPPSVLEDGRVIAFERAVKIGERFRYGMLVIDPTNEGEVRAAEDFIGHVRAIDPREPRAELRVRNMIDAVVNYYQPEESEQET